MSTMIFLGCPVLPKLLTGSEALNKPPGIAPRSSLFGRVLRPILQRCDHSNIYHLSSFGGLHHNRRSHPGADRWSDGGLGESCSRGDFWFLQNPVSCGFRPGKSTLGHFASQRRHYVMYIDIRHPQYLYRQKSLHHLETFSPAVRRGPTGGSLDHVRKSDSFLAERCYQLPGSLSGERENLSTF